MSLSQQVDLAQPNALRSGSLRAAVLCLIAGALCPLVPFVPMEHLFLYVTVLLMLLCWLVPIWHSWGSERFDWFAPIHVIGALYFVYFGLGSLAVVHDPKMVAYDLHIPPHVPRAAFYCLLGNLAALAAYYGPFRRPVLARYREQPVGFALLLGVGAVGLVGLFARAFMQQTFRAFGPVNVVAATAAQLAPLFIFCWALAWQLYFSKQLTWGQRVVLFGLLTPGVLVAIFFTYGNKSLSMLLVGLPIVARWYVKRKIPWVLLLVLLLLLVFVLFPLYNTYRWVGDKAGHAERVTRSYDTVSKWSSDTYMRNSLGTFVARMSMINSVAIVVRDVPSWQPFVGGETILMPIISNFIPRVLWRGKPAGVLDFGRRFRITDIFTSASHVAPSWPGELYWNFGLPGILFGLAAAAAGFRLIYRRYVECARGPVPIAIWIMLLSQAVVLLEAAVAPGIVEIVRSLILMELLRMFAVQYGLIVREPLTP